MNRAGGINSGLVLCWLKFGGAKVSGVGHSCLLRWLGGRVGIYKSVAEGLTSVVVNGVGVGLMETTEFRETQKRGGKEDG